MTPAALPNRRVEGWRWSDVSAAVGLDIPPPAPNAKSGAPPHPVFQSLQPTEIVFEDGRATIWPEKVGRSGPVVLSMKSAEAGIHAGRPGSPLATIAVAEMADDWFPIIESRKTGGFAVVRYVGGRDRFSRHTRVGVKVRKGEKLTLIESFEGEAAGFTNSLTECFVDPGGVLTRIVIQPAAGAATVVGTAEVFLSEGSSLRQFILCEGGKLARIETGVWTKAGAKVELNGVYLAAKGRHADMTSQVILGAEGAEVRQLVRGAARKGGRGVFQGRFKVERAAQKTDARMEHNALLLEEGAEVFAKPELEIYADDVQCAHGNTCGQLDEAAVFYLRQRGIPEAEARAMITRAFLIEALPDWLDETVRGNVEARIDAWLGTSA